MPDEVDRDAELEGRDAAPVGHVDGLSEAHFGVGRSSAGMERIHLTISRRNSACRWRLPCRSDPERALRIATASRRRPTIWGIEDPPQVPDKQGGRAP